MTATFDSDLAHEINTSLELMNLASSARDFIKSLYGSLAQPIRSTNSEFFIFYAKLEHYDQEPRKFMTRRLKYAEIRVGGKAIIGIVIDPTKKKTCLKQSLERVQAIYGVYLIAEICPRCHSISHR